jgi:hypothetical protein
LGLSAAALAGAALSARAAAPAADADSPPTRQEYNQMKQDTAELREEVMELRKELQEERAARAQTAAPSTQPVASATTPAEGAAKPSTNNDFATHDDTDALEEEIKAIKNGLDDNRGGLSNFHIAGDGEVGFTAAKGNKSTFDAAIAPLVLWQPNPRILIEAAADIGISTDDQGNSSTSFDLTLANINFLLNDYMNVGGGLFIVPFGVYHRHFDPPWINKFPDDPLPFGDGGIAPGEEVGAFVDGVVPLNRNSKLTYDIYLTNGPNLITNDPEAAGQLNFDDFTDLNNNKAVGGRIGFLPLPNIEMGYSIMAAQVNQEDFHQKTDAVLQAVDLNWRQDVDFLKGAIDFRTEWVWSQVDKATYDPDGSQGFGPISFNNNRNGGYVQLCYRPTKIDNKIIKNLEFVSRYDRLTSSHSAPGGDTEDRVTLGVDYWITPAVVFKTAYEFDQKQVGDNQNAFLVQVGFGL